MDATVSTLKKIDTKQGSGTEAVKGKTVIVHYTGWLYDPGQAEGKGRSSIPPSTAATRSGSRWAKGR